MKKTNCYNSDSLTLTLTESVRIAKSDDLAPRLMRSKPWLLVWVRSPGSGTIVERIPVLFDIPVIV